MRSVARSGWGAGWSGGRLHRGRDWLARRHACRRHYDGRQVQGLHHRGRGDRRGDHRGGNHLPAHRRDGAGHPGWRLVPAARRWLPVPQRWQGLVFGLLLLATVGPVLIEGDNRDFQLFGPKLLNISMFASLPLPLRADRGSSRRSPRARSPRTRAAAARPGALRAGRGLRPADPPDPARDRAPRVPAAAGAGPRAPASSIAGGSASCR